MFYLELFRALNSHEVQYLLVGGLAMNLHGVPRVTMDVDLIVGLDGENLRRFLAAADDLGLTPGAPVGIEELLDPDQRTRWTSDKGMVAFPLRPPTPDAPTVDILLDPPLDLPAGFERAEMRNVEDVTVHLACIDDMVRLKQTSGRKQDHADLEHLLRIQDSRRGV